MQAREPTCGGSLSSTATHPSSGRDPYLCEGLTEVHLCRAAQGFEASQAVSLGHSVLMLHGLASAAECEALRTDAVAGAAVERVHASRESRIRMQLETLREPSVALYDLLLLRACERVKDVLPTLLHDLFGADCLDDATLVRNERLGFSSGEPAINVYQAGGSFKAHQDHQSLTVLIPLSDSDTFVGGGTAFWSADQPLPEYGGSGVDGVLLGPPPAVELIPPAGTALLFVGSVTHAGTPISSGERCVLVCSFSPATGRCDLDLAHSAHHGAPPEVSAEHEAIEEEQLDNSLLTGEKVVLLL